MNLDARPTVEAIPPALIRAARADAGMHGKRAVDILAERLALPSEEFLLRLAQTFHYPVITMAGLREAQPAIDLIAFTECLRRECVAIRDSDGAPIVVFADPFNQDFVQWAEWAVKPRPRFCLALQSDVTAFLARQEDGFRAMDTVRAENPETGERGAAIESLSLRAISEDTSTVVRLVNSTLYDALKTGASDIHIESDAAGMTVKYRIDGVLTTVASIPGVSQAEQVISRLKVMSELDIAERRVPQDGRFQVNMQERDIDFRVSIMPSIFGEDAVLRILDRRALSTQMKGLRLDSLGFDQDSMARIRKLAREPYGMLLVTGPTGSGKTTTLYAALTEINNGQDKIITIEDPVEYQLPGVLQIPVNEKKGLTFARGLRSILRHDPDKIMVGEMRDAETAQIAVQSALTGHLVFTTVHANNVFDVLGRIVHMGIDTYSFASALNGIVAQRLLRVACPQCVEPYSPDETLLKQSGIDAAGAETYVFMKGRGCGHCRGTGYKGRKAIAEILMMNDSTRRLIVDRALAGDMREAARTTGTRYLREQALELVRNGETTLEEINRVTFVA